MPIFPAAVVLCKISLLRESESLKKSSWNGTQGTNNSSMLRPSHTFSLSVSFLWRSNATFFGAVGYHSYHEQWGRKLRMSAALNQIKAMKSRGETQRVTASLREARNHSAAVETETKASYPSRVAVSPTKWDLHTACTETREGIC